MSWGTGKTGRKLIGVVIVGLVVFAGGQGCRAGLVPVNAASVIREGIEYYIETDKIVYDLGEDVEILYRITNLRDEQWRVAGSGSNGDVIVESKEGMRDVWSWYATRGGPGHAGPRILRLQPNETYEITAVWEQSDYNGTFEFEDDFAVMPGRYEVLGIVEGTENFSHPIYRSVGTEITIIPEPGSFGLFALAALCLKHHCGRREN